MTTTAPTQRAPELPGQTVVVIGGSAGIGLETARRARAEGADVVLTARNPERLERAARELGAVSTAAFDATDTDRLGQFFESLPAPIDHVVVTAGGPHYEPTAEMDFTVGLAPRRRLDALHNTLPIGRVVDRRTPPLWPCTSW
jgi:NAD(P)-dependent dehydrogenase (short-subunit alcohol dehydrogenase family)